MIDFNKPIGRNAINMESYNAKFRLADDFMNGKIPESQIHEIYVRLLTDKTTFAYMNFRDSYGNMLKLYPWQDLVINDSNRFKYIRSANQIGKTLLLNVDATIDFLMDHGHAYTRAIVSKSLPQAHNQHMRKIKEMLGNMKLRWRSNKNETENMSVITTNIYESDKKTIKYSNMLICAPCTEGLLGYDVDGLDLDEFEYWEDVEKGVEWFYNQIAEPRTYHTKGKITIISNPNGMDNYGAVLENLRMPDGNRKFHTYVFDFMDDPTHNLKDLEIAKVGKTRMVIESTLLAIRSISDRNYFTHEEITKSYDDSVSFKPYINLFMFLDVGAKHDQSVLSIGYIDYPNGEEDLPHIYVPIIHCYPVGYPLSRVIGAYSPEQDSDGWHYEKSVKDY